MKITAFDPRYSQNLSIGDTYIGGSNGSNSSFAGGDVVGEPGSLSVVSLRNLVSLSSNMGDNTIGSVLTTISSSPWIATFAMPSNTGSSSSIPWFVVTDYGAVGDNSTDDRAAINLAIAALISAGRGVLYFPAGQYYVSNALTALTVPCLVLGDGPGRRTSGASIIATDHATAKVFTVSTAFIEIRGLGIINFAVTPASGSSAIATTTGGGTVCAYRDLWVEGFYDNVDLQYGGRWALERCEIVDPTRYGIRIANIDSPDGGDWVISDSQITTSSAATHTPTAGIRQESAGGGKFTNVKVNSDTGHEFLNAYSLDINGATNSTSVLTIASCSFENMSDDAIVITTSSTGRFAHIAIVGCQFGMYSNNTGRVVNLAAAATGGYSAAGGLGNVVIDGIVAYTDGTARAAISLTKTDNVTLGDMQLQGFNARYTSSADTNTTDGAASALTVKDEGVSLATAATSLDFVGSGVTASGTGAAKTITITSGGTTHYEILMASGSADPLLTSDGLDYLYVEVPN